MTVKPQGHTKNHRERTDQFQDQELKRKKRFDTLCGNSMMHNQCLNRTDCWFQCLLCTVHSDTHYTALLENRRQRDQRLRHKCSSNRWRHTHLLLSLLPLYTSCSLNRKFCACPLQCKEYRSCTNLLPHRKLRCRCYSHILSANQFHIFPPQCTDPRQPYKLFDKPRQSHISNATPSRMAD